MQFYLGKKKSTVKSSVPLFYFTVFFLLCATTVAQAKTVVAINIYPQKVGVFYQNKTQQFQAIAVFSDKTTADYTKKVGWSIGANPFTGQSLQPNQVAIINENGLATVKNTWGRVNVVATYPKPVAPKPPISLTGVYDILLAEPRCSKKNLELCVEESTCKAVGGFWWTNGACRVNKQPLGFLAAIYHILSQ